MKSVTFPIPQELLDRIVKMQKEQTVFSRSKMIRELLEIGLKELEQNKGA